MYSSRTLTGRLTPALPLCVCPVIHPLTLPRYHNLYEDDGFPLLSSNIGKISLENGIIEIKYSIRSSDLLKENELLKEIKILSNQYGFEFNIDAKKPFFPFKENSNIRKILAETYKELYNKETVVKKVHACMEGGILSSNIADLDICTIAPTINNCHSINECVSISSTNRVYNWLKVMLEKYNSFDKGEESYV